MGLFNFLGDVAFLPWTVTKGAVGVGKMGYDALWGDGPNLDGKPVAAPPPPPDITDQTLQAARLAARRRAMTGGVGATFLSGPLGDASRAPGQAPTLSGI